MGGNRADKKIELRRVAWDETAKRHLSIVPQPDPTISGLDYHCREIEAGRAALFGVFVNGSHAATFTAAVYENDRGSVFEVLMIGSDDPKAGVMDALPGITSLARQAGADVVVFSTVRKGLAKIAESMGYRLDEYVLRKAVNEQ